MNDSANLSRHLAARRVDHGMVLDGVQAWLSGWMSGFAGWHRGIRQPANAPSLGEEAPEPADPDPPEIPPVWPASRIAAAETVWGEGFIMPGGHEEVARLARPMGLSQSASLLLVGAGTGGPVCGLAEEFGVWVTGCESDPDLEARAQMRATQSGLGRRANIESWNPEVPDFDTQRFHQILALEPLREAGASREEILAALARAARPNGQMTLVEIVATGPFDMGEAGVASWLLLERRRGVPPTRPAITRMIERLGFDVRVVEDLSERHMRQTLEGWHAALQAMRHEPPAPEEARDIVGEAERWLTRKRLLRAERLRLLRWHATGKKSVPPP